jgi:hypothetical protein
MSELTALALLGTVGLVYAIHKGTQKNKTVNRNGAINGAINGARNGARNGTRNGTRNGKINGTRNGKINGARNGARRVLFEKSSGKNSERGIATGNGTARRNRVSESGSENQNVTNTDLFVKNVDNDIPDLRVILQKDRQSIINFFSFKQGSRLMTLLYDKKYDMINNILANRPYILDITVIHSLQFGQLLSLIRIHIPDKYRFIKVPIPDKYRFIKVSILMNILENFYKKLSDLLSKYSYNDKLLSGDNLNTFFDNMEDYNTHGNICDHIDNQLYNTFKDIKVEGRDMKDPDYNSFFQEYETLKDVCDSDLNTFLETFLTLKPEV